MFGFLSHLSKTPEFFRVVLECAEWLKALHYHTSTLAVVISLLYIYSSLLTLVLEEGKEVSFIQQMQKSLTQIAVKGDHA